MKKCMGLFLVFFGLVANIAAANADVSIKAFEGIWEGSAVSRSNASVSFPISSRDLDVEIRQQDNGGFSITWRTLLRQKGQPGAPEEVVKETTRNYLPKEGGKLWEATPTGDFYNGKALSWASLQGQVLKIYSLALRKTGEYDMLIYSRTLTGLNMKLDFKALRDGEVRRTASGTLIKSGK